MVKLPPTYGEIGNGFLLFYQHYRVFIEYLVGGIPTPLKNDGLRQLGWLFHSQYDGKVVKKSMVPVTTHQVLQ